MIAVVAAGALAAIPVSQTVDAQADMALSQAGLPTDMFPWQGIAARDTLRRIIGGLARTTPAHGTYTYIHLHRWPADPALGALPSAVEEIKAWRAADGSGSRSSTIVGQPGTRYESGGLPMTTGNPATMPEVLAGQLDHYSRQLRLRMPETVGIMNEQMCLTSEQRTATLQVLADTGGLLYLGRVKDRSGRDGVAFAMTGQDNQGADVRDILIFDESSGELFSYEQQAAVLSARTQTRPAAVLSYVLYLECGHTDYQGQTP
ncbi:MAG TPA: hypothetical protein DGT23_07075 [Micromonosporaceae bacterium]|nr:hypothetical protein [Micromonosporaceae bacterium]